MRNHEMIYVFYKKSGTYNPQKTAGDPYSVTRDKGEPRKTNYGNAYKSSTDNTTGDRHPVSILDFSKKTNHKAKHPTEKPVDVCEWIVNSYSKEGDTILDFTMGSGTTGVACSKLNRKFIGIEMEKKYFDVACERLNLQDNK